MEKLVSILITNSVIVAIVGFAVFRKSIKIYRSITSIGSYDLLEIRRSLLELKCSYFYRFLANLTLDLVELEIRRRGIVVIGASTKTNTIGDH